MIDGNTSEQLAVSRPFGICVFAKVCEGAYPSSTPDTRTTSERDESLENAFNFTAQTGRLSLEPKSVIRERTLIFDRGFFLAYFVRSR